MDSAKNKKSSLKQPITYQQVFGGVEAFRSIAKTAINYYIYRKGNPENIVELIPFLLGKNEMDIVKHFHPNKSIYKKSLTK